MNYYGVNRRMPTVDTRWVGPKARLETTKQLNEVVEHVIVMDATKACRVGESTVKYTYNRLKTRWPEWKLTVERTPLEYKIIIHAPKWELIEEGVISG